jgi:hypothetical protein
MARKRKMPTRKYRQSWQHGKRQTKMPNKLSEGVISFFYDVVHSEVEITLVFGEGSDVIQRVTFEWADAGFYYTVETQHYAGTIQATRFQPAEHCVHLTEDTYHSFKVRDVLDLLKREHNIDLGADL